MHGLRMGRRATPARLRLARAVCSRLPPVGAQKVRRLLYPWSAAQSDDHRFTVRSQTGSSFTGTTADFVGYAFAVHRYFNWRSVLIAQSICRTGDTIIEVGANVGSETIAFSDIVGESGRVHAFEPFPANVEELRANTARTRHRNVSVLPVALSDRNGQVSFAPPWAHNSGSGQVVAGQGAADAGPGTEVTVEVLCATLDSLESRLGPARLLAIDAEGHELSILGGASAYLRTHRPVIVVEVLEHRLAAVGASPAEVAAHLRDMGYELFEIARFGTRAIGRDPLAVPRAGDWVAIPVSEGGLGEQIRRALLRGGLMPMIAGLNPLCARR